MNPNFYYNKYQIMDTDSLLEELKNSIFTSLECFLNKWNMCNICKKRYRDKKELNNDSSVLIVSK